MRTAPLLIAMVLASATTAPALALQADDGMTAWKQATNAERLELIEKLLGKDSVGSDKVMTCMNGASAVPGHAELPIAEVARACASEAGQPV